MVTRAPQKKHTTKKDSKRSLSRHTLMTDAKRLVHGETTLKSLEQTHTTSDIKKILELAGRSWPEKKEMLSSKTKSTRNVLPRLTQQKIATLIEQELIREVEKRHAVFQNRDQEATYWIWNRGPELPTKQVFECRCHLNVLPMYYGEVAHVVSRLTKALEPHGIQFKFKLPSRFKHPLEGVSCIGYLELPRDMSFEHIRGYRSYVEKYLKTIPSHALQEVLYLYHEN